ncbi:hypothetical protein [Aurantimonas coralicida]|uniref:hypothetical protein n=1 Tax=Aurantimonas coralicida TaxID=182270 RepID=UPI001D182774|nr:hypothetical protein [Aurantimonas coralicida]MCC4299680.1 hypothetical protein [Aurantimonas coralicida]
MHENIGDVLLSEAYPRALFEQVEANDATIRIVGEPATLALAGTASRAESDAVGASVFADLYGDGAPDRMKLGTGPWRSRFDGDLSTSI